MSTLPNLELLVGVPSGSAVVQDYVKGDESALAFFGAHFADAAAYRARAQEVDGRFDRAARERAAKAMRAPGAGDEARLERFVEEGGYVVTTGQQPGLFGGPLYSVYKALTAIRLAEALEETVGRPVLPLFWIASEDHDWDEVDHAYVVGVDNDLHRLQVANPDPDVSPPLHRVRLGGDAGGVVADFVGHLPETDFSTPYTELLGRAYREGSTLPEAFGHVLDHVLGGRGLFRTDAADPVVKEASRATLLEELQRAEELERVLAGTGERLTEAGYGHQVALLEGATNLFVEGPAGRERLYRENGGYRLRTSEERLTAEDVRAGIEGDRGTVSPNVFLRPVVEGVVFPSLAYVAGPGEMAYYAQLGAYYEAFGTEMPVIHPRFGVTVVEPKIRKVLEKFGLEIGDLDRPFHEIAGDIARDEMPASVQKALGALRGAIGKGTGEVQKEVMAIDPTLKGPVQHVRSHAFDAIDDLEKKVLHAIKRENEIALAQLEKAQLHLFPLGKPAERVQSPFYFLSRFGEAFVEGLYDAFEVNLR